MDLNQEQLSRLAGYYDGVLEQLGVSPIAPDDQSIALRGGSFLYLLRPRRRAALSHARWMLQKVPHLESAQKMRGWIAFVEGLLWAFGILSINECRKAVLAAKEGPDEWSPDELRRARQTYGLTQQEAGRLFNVSFPTFNRWENGHNRPSRTHLRMIRNFIDGAGGLGNPSAPLPLVASIYKDDPRK